jgi:hypothetical protein
MDHPIRRPDVHADVEAFTVQSLSPAGGTGKVLVEFDFKDWRAVSYRPIAEGVRRPLSTSTGRG